MRSYVLLRAHHFLCAVRQRNKEITEIRPTRLLCTKSGMSVVVFARCAAWNTYKYYTLPLCNGDTRPTRAYVVRLYLMVSVLCLTITWRTQATLVSETKKPVIRAVCIIVPEHSITRANLNKNTLVHKIRRSYRIKCNYQKK